MILRSDPSSLVTVRGPTSADADFTASTDAVDEVAAGALTTTQTVDDAVFDVYDPATIDHQRRIVIEASGFPDLTYTNLDTAIGSLGDDRVVRRVQDGTCRILIRSGYVTRKVFCRLSRTDAAATNIFTHFVTGSLAKHISDATDALIVGQTSTHMPIFTSRNTSTGVYVRNASCWASSLNLTAYCPNRNAVAVSPRHVYAVEHAGVSGATLHFVTADNTTITRTVTGVQNIGPSNGSDGYATDMQVAILDSDLPASITPVKVLPANLAAKIPGVGYGIPALCTDAERRAHVHDLYSIDGFIWFRVPTNATRMGLYESIIGGDSGSPNFLLINGAPVLICSWTYGGPGSGAAAHLYLTEINAAMTTLGGGYQLTQVDLSGFPSY